MFPPFDPDRDERKRRPNVFARGQVPVRVLIPNIFTLVGLCAGLTAIRMGIEHRWDLAVAALVFAVGSALRLARFNVSLDATDTPAWKSNYFVGVPAPAGAIILLLPLSAERLGLHR